MTSKVLVCKYPCTRSLRAWLGLRSRASHFSLQAGHFAGPFRSWNSRLFRMQPEQTAQN